MENENIIILKVGDAVRHVHDVQRGIVCIGLVDMVDDERGTARVIWASPAQYSPKWMRWYQKHLLVRIS